MRIHQKDLQAFLTFDKALLLVLCCMCNVAIEASWHTSANRGRTRWVQRANTTYGAHYFFGTSAIPLGRHDGFYKNTLVSYNTVAYGITEHFTAMGSLDLVSLIASRQRAPIWNVRLQVNTSSDGAVNVGVNVFYLNVPSPAERNLEADEVSSPGFAAAMGLITFGDADNNVTLSGGWLHNGQEAGKGPLLSAAGALRLFPNVQCIAEVWSYADTSDPYFAYSGGVRVLGNELAIDVGLVYDKEFTNKVTSIGVPFISATLNF